MPRDELERLSARLNAAHRDTDCDAAFRAAEEALNRMPEGPARRPLWDLLAFWGPFTAAIDTPGLQRLARHWAQAVATSNPGAPLPPLPPPQAGRRPLRVGYLAPFLSLDQLPLASHDPAAVVAIAYHPGAQPLGPDTPIPRFAGFRELAGLPARQAAERIRADGIDLLVDLGGSGAAQGSDILAWRPAPLQVGWSNKLLPQFPPLLDAAIGDAVLFGAGDFALPDGPALHCLPQAAVAVADLEPRVPPGPPPALANGFVTFGSTAATYKLSEAALALWAEVLRAVPQARFVYSAPRLPEAIAAKIRRAFAAGGVAEGRLSLKVHEHERFRGHLDRIDIALDSTPFSSNFTCFQALSQGVPVIALAGDRLAGRFSASLLATVGHGELVAADRGGYLRLAVALAAAPQRLSAYRTALPAAVAAARLEDRRHLAAMLEGAYRRIWEEAAAGR